MINIFRKIRKQLANENKFKKYFRYAFGEVVLIMLGIFMALQLQNWNEHRKQEAQFKVTLEQLYNTIKFDTEWCVNQIKFLDWNIDIIDGLLYQTDSIDKSNLPYEINTLIQIDDEFSSESSYHAQNLKYRADNPEQNEISKQIVGYINQINTIDISSYSQLESSLQDLDIAFPEIDPDNINDGWIEKGSTYYSKDDLNRLYNALKSNKLRAVLKTLRSHLIYDIGTLFKIKSNGTSIIKSIKNYYPDVKILYKNVGIIGTSLNGYDAEGGFSTPMIETDFEKSIWEIDLLLKEGTVKFRCNDSWAQNWGADWGNIDAFPKAKAISEGANIPIKEAGNYHITLNLTENTYKFIKQD